MNNILLVLIIIVLLLVLLLKDLVYFYKVNIGSKFNDVFVDINNNNFINKQKILILSMDDRDLEYIEYHKRSFNEYSLLNDYTFLFNNICDNLPIYFCKFQEILSLMGTTDYDYYIWVDSDTIVNKMYMDFPLESMIEQMPENTELVTTYFYTTGVLLKALIGSFYMFKNENVMKLLNDCVNYINKKYWGNNTTGECTYSGHCYEEAALFYSLENNNINHYRIIGDFIDNTGSCNKNSFIIHKWTKENILDCFKENSKN